MPCDRSLARLVAAVRRPRRCRSGGMHRRSACRSSGRHRWLRCRCCRSVRPRCECFLFSFLLARTPQSGCAWIAPPARRQRVRAFARAAGHRRSVPRLHRRTVARTVRARRPLSWESTQWPERPGFALVLSHDVDFVPTGLTDTLKQGAKTMFRHLVRQRDPADAIPGADGPRRALAGGTRRLRLHPRDHCQGKGSGRPRVVPGGGRASPSQRRQLSDRGRSRSRLPARDPRVRLRPLLHGSYRSTENPAWYAEEVALLSQRLGAPTGLAPAFSFVRLRCPVRSAGARGNPLRHVDGLFRIGSVRARDFRIPISRTALRRTGPTMSSRSASSSWTSRCAATWGSRLRKHAMRS